MAQTQVNIKRLVDNIRKSNAYTPLVEAIANSIDSISESNREDGHISITLYRKEQGTLGNIAGDDLKPFSGFSVTDNGIGFNDKNVEAFNTIYTEKKIREGGKGFGRFVFLKYFEDVDIDSVYNDKGVFYRRTFQFVKDNTIIQNDKTERTQHTSPETTLNLNDLKLEHANKIDKTIETLSRKLLEKLLVYFVIDGFKCPKITVKDAGNGASIILNDLIGTEAGISKVADKEFTLESEDKSARETFSVKVFKIFYGESRSAVSLVADKRLVTDEALYTYIPEFKDDFYDVETNGAGKEVRKSFTIKTYVQGRYLNEHVSLERDGFDFGSTSNADLFLPFTQPLIERSAATVTKDVFPAEIKTRQDKKDEDIRKYVDTKAPWHKSNLADLNRFAIPYKATEAEIETALEQVRFEKERKTRSEVERILADTDEAKVAEKADALIEQITDIQKNELAHYVALRRAIIDIFKKSLAWSSDKKYEKEQVIHDIIFPTKSTSDTMSYDRHNLWLLDEKLSFTEYIASDKALNSTDERPDLLVFENKIVVRDGDTASNPITVFEFKKPQREQYDDDENPIVQVAGYIKKIRNGDFKNPEGRYINATHDTPAFGYLVCDLTEKIRQFCDDVGLVKSPDNQGYFGYLPAHRIYFQVISFPKLVEDSELRNKIFFKMLGMQ